MTEKHLILATAGHVDHGKTALVKALTGVDTDRLPEEKARGITIDLGFAQFALPGVSIGVIDVPGHEDFIHNMIAGLGAIDLALLVVAADDGWMPQTEEHFQILNYLGIRHGVVAITKCDLGDPARITADVRKQLRGTSLGEAPIVQTSIRAATGLDELEQALAKVSARIPPPRDCGKPRLFVDRVFTVRGTGTVVTGTLTGGRLSRGKTISLQPQNLQARIRAIQSHKQSLEVVLPGTRTALNLPEVRPDEISRGSVITTTDCSESSHVIDAKVERSVRAFLPSRPLKNASLVQMHYGSARFTARIILLDRGELLPGETAIARLRLTKSAFVFAGDRFLIRDSSGRQTIAGGVVLNPHAEGTRFRAPTERSFLEARAVAPDDLIALLTSRLQRDQFVRRAVLLRQSSFSEQEITNAIARLTDEKKAFASGPIVADAVWWEALQQCAIDAIEKGHTAHPERTGLDLAQLRAHLSLHDTELENVLIAVLSERDFPCTQGAIKRRSHQPSLPTVLEMAGEKIRTALGARPFDPPSRKDLVVDAAAKQALRFLSETGEVVLLSEDVILSVDAFAEMKSRIAQTIRASGPATAGELRQVLGTTRRIIIPLLERCDRDGLTSRQGDRRKLRLPRP